MFTFYNHNLTGFKHFVFQFGLWHEDGPEDSSEEVVQTLPVHHPRKENLQRAAAAQTHEARECKSPTTRPPSPPTARPLISVHSSVCIHALFCSLALKQGLHMCAHEVTHEVCTVSPNVRSINSPLVTLSCCRYPCWLVAYNDCWSSFRSALRSRFVCRDPRDGGVDRELKLGQSSGCLTAQEVVRFLQGGV